MDEHEAGDELWEALERFGFEVQQLLERTEQHASPDPAQLNTLFRQAHSIKGLAGLFGQAHVGSLAHAAEDLLDALRLGKAVFTDEVDELLRQLPDALGERLIAGDARSVPSTRGELLEDRIRIGIEEAAVRPGQPAQAALVPAEIRSLLTAYEEHRLSHNVSLGHGVYALLARLPLMTFDAELRAVRAKALELGEVIATLPGADVEPGDKLACELLLASPRPSADVIKHVAPDMTVRVLREASVRQAQAPVEQSVRVDIRKFDQMLEVLSELELTRLGLTRLAARLGLARAPATLVTELVQESRRLERRLGELQSSVLESRMIPLGPMLTRAKRMAERVARELGKEAAVEVVGEDVEIDKFLAEALAEPIVHLTRNALAHGIETPAAREQAGKPRQGKLTLRASHRGNLLAIEVRDDGRGIDPARVRQVAETRGLLPPQVGETLSKQDLVRLILLPGFSTASAVGTVSGRGVGLDAVRDRVTSLHGFLEVESEPGQGATFTVVLPSTLALLRALIVRDRGRTYALPTVSIWEMVGATPEDLSARSINRGETSLPLVALGDLLGYPGTASRRPVALMVGPSKARVGLVVDGLIGQRDLISKPLGPLLSRVEGVSGLAQLGPEQAPVLVLDVPALVDLALGRPSLRTGAVPGTFPLPLAATSPPAGDPAMDPAPPDFLHS